MTDRIVNHWLRMARRAWDAGQHAAARMLLSRAERLLGGSDAAQ